MTLVRRVIVRVFMLMLVIAMTMAVSRILAAAQQPGARDIHHQAGYGNRYRLGEVNRNRRQKSRDSLISDEYGNHRKHDGAGESGQIAELSGAEDEARVMRMPASVGVGQRRDQHRARVSRHV